MDPADTIESQRIAALRNLYDGCFGCGRENPIGLKLDGFASHNDVVSASFTPGPEYGGFENTLHGGVVATALDEISAWTAMIGHGVMVFTATLELRYKAQAPVDVTYAVTGTVSERRGRRLRIGAEMSHGGTVVAESKGLFVVAEQFTADLERVTTTK